MYISVSKFTVDLFQALCAHPIEEKAAVVERE